MTIMGKKIIDAGKFLYLSSPNKQKYTFILFCLKFMKPTDIPGGVFLINSKLITSFQYI